MVTATVTPTRVDGDLAEVMDSMPYGVYIIGSHDALGEPNGMMADWVMQVSFKPRMIAVSFENDSHTLANIREGGWFSVNFLPASEDGQNLGAQFLQPYDGSKVRGRSQSQMAVLHHKMEMVPHSPAPYGSPVLAGSNAWLECEAARFIAAGDHTLVIATVRAGELRRHVDTLSSDFSGWTYSG